MMFNGLIGIGLSILLAFVLAYILLKISYSIDKKEKSKIYMDEARD